jgi:hypothetical protein
MIKLKNILAENMLRFGVKNLSETNKHVLSESLLLEVDETYWDAIQGIGNNPKGKKQVIKEYAASNPLTYPGKGAMMFTDLETKPPVYVGALLQAFYQPLVKPVQSPSYALSAPFGYYLTVYLADEQNSKGHPNNKSHQADWFIVKCAQLKSGKVQILTIPAFSEPFKKRPMDTAKGGARASVELALSMALKDLDSWTGTLRNTINIELQKMGFPALPNSLTWNGIQDVV